MILDTSSVPFNFPNGVIATSSPTAVTRRTVQVALSKTGSAFATILPTSLEIAEMKKDTPTKRSMLFHVRGLVFAFASSSREAPTSLIRRTSALVHALNSFEKLMAHRRNITYITAQTESITSEYAMLSSLTSKTACTASIFPLPPNQLPHNAPSAFQLSGPNILWKIA